MTNDITIYQYDMLDFNLALTVPSGQTYELNDGEVLWARVKTCPRDKESLISANQPSKHFTFQRVSLKPGTYLLETGIIFENGMEYTITQSNLIIKPRLKEQ